MRYSCSFAKNLWLGVSHVRPHSDLCWHAKQGLDKQVFNARVQATQRRRSSTPPEASSRNGVQQPPDSPKETGDGSTQPSRGRENTEMPNGSQSEQSTYSAEQRSRFASPPFRKPDPQIESPVRDSASNERKHSASDKSAMRDDIQGESASIAGPQQMCADGGMGHLHENDAPKIHNMHLDMQASCCSNGSESTGCFGEVIGEYVLYRFA